MIPGYMLAGFILGCIFAFDAHNKDEAATMMVLCVFLWPILLLAMFAMYLQDRGTRFRS